METKIRALRADEIEVRVAAVTQKGCQLLLYKDARCDKRILDEVFGPMLWQDRYEMIDDVLYCSVGVYNTDLKEWIWKQDCGTESFSDKDKGQASDAFKRACFNWGIGRELYTKIFIFVNCETVKDEAASQKAKKDVYRLKDKYATFRVSEVKTDNEKEKITKLVIVKDGKEGTLAFEYPRSAKKDEDKITSDTPFSKPPEESTFDKVVNERIEYLKKCYKGANLKKLLEANGVESIEKLPVGKVNDLYYKCLEKAGASEGK